MRKEQKEIGQLWALRIGGEVFSLSWTYCKFFTMIQVTFMLPSFALWMLAAGYLREWKAQDGFGPAARADAPPLPNNLDADRTVLQMGLVRNFAASFSADRTGLQLGLAIVALLLSWAVTIFFIAAMLSLPSAAIIYAVGLHYTGQIVSFLDVVRAVVPRLWMRLTITQIYYILVLHGLAAGQLLAEVVLVKQDPVAALSQLYRIAVLMFFVMICLDTIFRLASGDVVLGKDYGWAAVRRTPELLRGRVWVALFCQWLSVGSFLKFIQLQGIMFAEAAKAVQAVSKDSSPSGKIESGLESVIVSLYFILGLFFFWQMSAVSSGVQYASFKAYRNEALDESFFEKQAKKVQYELIGSGTVDAKLGEHDSQSLV